MLTKSLSILILLISLTQAVQQCPATLPEDSQPLTTTYSFQSTSKVESLFPLTPLRICQIILILFVTGLANAGGMGGGPLLSPIFIVILGYTENDAIEMVYALVFGGSLGNFINVVRRRDLKNGSPLINYDLNLICMPPMLLGGVLGVTLNRVIAPICIIIGLAGVAAYSLPKIYKKAKKAFKEETKAMEALVGLKATQDNSKNDQGTLATEKSSENSRKPLEQRDSREIEIENSANYGEGEGFIEEVQMERDSQYLPPLFPKLKVGVILVLMITIMLLALLRGTQNFNSIIGVSYCRATYWSIYSLGVIVCCIMSYFTLKAQTKAQHATRSFYESLEEHSSTLVMAGKHKTKLVMISFIAGILASTLGVGGGMIMSPTLLGLGMSAQAVAATSGFFVLQITFVSLFQSCLYGDIPLEDRGLMLLTAIVGSYFISACLSWLVSKYRRPSILLFTLVMVLISCLITTPVSVLLRNMNDMDRILSFKSLC